jgi:hypothetical protein
MRTDQVAAWPVEQVRELLSEYGHRPGTLIVAEMPGAWKI